MSNMIQDPINQSTIANIDNTPVGEKPGLSNPITEKLESKTTKIALRIFLGGVVVAMMLGTAAALTYFFKGSSEAVFGLLITAAIIFGSLLLTGLLMFATDLLFLRRKIEELQQGNYYVLWSYSSEEWAEHIKHERKIADGHTMTGLWSGVGLGLLGGIIAGFFGPIYLAITFAVGSSILGLVGGFITELIIKADLRKRANNPESTIIGFKGLYRRGHFYPYFGFGYGLSDLQMSKKDSSSYLVFTFYSKSKNGSVYNDIRIPVPTGKEHEAEAILDMTG